MYAAELNLMETELYLRISPDGTNTMSFSKVQFTYPTPAQHCAVVNACLYVIGVIVQRTMFLSCPSELNI